MAAGVELTESGKTTGIVMDFPANLSSSSSGSPSSSSSSPVKIPRRVRQRLIESKSPSITTVEEIETKLKEADLRRQQFHDWLSSKARPKPRSPSWSSSQEDDLAQKLEAKLQAADQKRLSILAKAQKRLARLDELRQAAKTGVELRYEKKREKLGTVVESRVQQAEANRMLLLKANKQRRAAAKERRAQSLLQRTVQESKYKECVRASISQKRAAAEKKRLGLLEAEKKRTHARLMQVKRAAKFVNYQREIERKRIKDQLEDRLQRAKSQRAEYLRQRGSLHSSVRSNWYEMHKQGDFLSRKLARCWRHFVSTRRTTHALVKVYDALDINEQSVQTMPFEQLALRIESSATIQTVKDLVDRLETRLTLSHSEIALSSISKLDNIDHLLKRLSSPKKRGRPSNNVRKGGAKKVGSSREVAQNPAKLSRYPVRVVLCAYMILGHPDAVFSGNGEREISLTESATNFIREFEMLIKVVLDGPVESGTKSPVRRTIRSQLKAFDAAWCSYLYRFVVWKVKDARSLEEDLVRAACQLELSMMQKCKVNPEGSDGALSHDMKAIQNQVSEDHRLLRDKVHHLSGDAGIDRMESALSDTRSRFFQAKENGNPIDSPVAHIFSPTLPGSPATVQPSSMSDEGRSSLDGGQKPSHVRSLFKDASSPSKANVPSTSDENLARENEMLVNEIVHGNHHALADSFELGGGVQNGVKAKVRETLENAFWDGIAEAMQQSEPEYGRLVELVKEVRDDLCEMAPQSWRLEIHEAIDIDILSQVLMSGNHDMNYLGKILEFALVTLQKLSAPATEGEMKVTHEKLLKELSEVARSKDESSVSFLNATIKGLRFVLEQIQALKREISKARIKIMEPLIKGPAGLEYLAKTFASRYGPPSDASISLPLTIQWLASVRGSAEEEWQEHKNSLSALVTSADNSSQGLPPSTSLRTGSSLVESKQFQMATFTPNSTTGGQPECKGEKIDKLARLGLLKLVSGIEGITEEILPETLKLNFLRLRSIQSQIQKIIVISTSLLVLRQTLVSNNSSRTPSVMDDVITDAFKALVELLDSVEDVGVAEIVGKLYVSAENNKEALALDLDKIKASKEVMANMLLKSLRSGDPVFERVSRSVYLAVRAVVLGGTGETAGGKKLAEASLRRVGGAALIKKVVEAGEVLIIVGKVSGSVHGPWYDELMKN